MRCFSIGLAATALALVACADDALAPAAGGGGAFADATAGSAPSAGQTGEGGGASDGGGSSTGGGAGQGGAPPSACAAQGPSGDLERMVDVGGEARRVLLHVPPGLAPDAATPLVVVMHGFTESPEDIRAITHFDEVADERGFIVAYPEGKSGSWNGGTCCGLSELMGEPDVTFVSAVIDDVSASHCVDPTRVHAAGFSNGGFMAHRLACELSDRIASIGVVAGQESLESCTPARPVAVLQIHGTSDPVVPFGGNPFLGYPTTESTVTGWIERDQCEGEETSTYDADGVSCVARQTCAASAAVELCTVDGGGHDWFGGGDAWTADGPPDGFVATLHIADFLAAHPMN
ncbi:MAG: hydrolase [Myxococcales bacterium]|nr:hydrolase [Myxococcales bacterium]